MDIAAFLVSLAAVVIAGLSWRTASRSARAAERAARETGTLAALEAERRHHERTPVCAVTAHEVASGVVEFILTHEGPEEEYEVDVVGIDGSIVETFRQQQGEPVSRQELGLGPARIGSRTRFFGSPKADTGQELQQMRFRFRRSEETWTKYITVVIHWLPPPVIQG